MRIVFCVLSLLSFSFGVSAKVQNGWKDVELSCSSDADCGKLRYLDCCEASTCVNSAKTRRDLDVRLTCTKKVDCVKAQAEARFVGCECAKGMCQARMKDASGKERLVVAPPASR